MEATDSIPPLPGPPLHVPSVSCLPPHPSNPMPELSIIIPAYNEARRLPETLEKLKAFEKEVGFQWEVVVVIEKSSDNTLEITKELIGNQANFRIVAPGVQRGKGHAVRLGMLEATGEILLFMDADLSVPLEEVLVFQRYFAAHPEADILVGSRKHASSRIIRSQRWVRRRMGEAFNGILRGLTGITIRDTQCGFKAFRREAARKVFAHQRIDGFAFDVEVLLLANRFGLEVRELPVQWINSPDSRVCIVRDSLKMLRDALRIRRMVEDVPHPGKS